MIIDRDAALFERLERFFDTVCRDAAAAEDHGGLVLFVRTGPGWPFYARPRRGAGAPSAADLAAVRARQRELGVPEAFEWVHETTPSLLADARAGGLAVLQAPLLVLDPAALPADRPPAGASVRLLDPGAPSFAGDLATQRAVAQVGFGVDGTAVGTAGPAQRDAALRDLAADDLAAARHRTRTGRIATAVVESPANGAVATGVLQRVDDVAEIAGVATLPVARRRGLGAAVTAALARHALASGVDLVFLSAGSAAVARVYQRVGFRRIGTACIAEPAPAERVTGPDAGR